MNSNSIIPNMINDEDDAAVILEVFNTMIRGFWTLQDNYYIEHPLNTGTTALTALESIGFTSEWLIEVAEKMELARAILYGCDGIDWDFVEAEYKKHGGKKDD